MIVEGLVTTTSAAGLVNVAPMGPLTDPELSGFVLRPFTTSTTWANLRDTGEGVFHIVDDVELLAHAAVGRVCPPMRDAEHVRGKVLLGACRFYEFRVAAVEAFEARASVRVTVVHRGRLRDFFGFNRAKHAVVEAAILATRVGILPADSFERELERLRVPVEKTGGTSEVRAFAFLEQHIRARLGLAGSPAAPPRPVSVLGGSRLHFGLLEPWGRQGGLGMMVEAPAVEVRAGAAKRAHGDGTPLGRRAAAVARAVTAALRGGNEPPEGETPGVEVVRCPPEHVGLGTGTQLTLATARAVVAALGAPPPGLAELARWTGRGVRSAVGAHGFAHGGFLLDGGHGHSGAGAERALAPLSQRLEVPAGWAVLLVVPARERGVAGSSERAAFAALMETGGGAGHLERTAELCREVLLGLLPALATARFDEFSAALGECQRRVGELFAPVQGGVFATDRTAALVRYLRGAGAAGAGQSSWGPTVFAVFPDIDGARFEARRLEERFSLAPGEVLVTRALNHGAQTFLGDDHAARSRIVAGRSPTDR